MRGHAARGPGGFRGEPAAGLPDPGQAETWTEAEWDALEDGAAILAEPGPAREPGRPAAAGPVEDVPGGGQDGTGDLRDAEPAHGSREWGGPPRAARVTAAVRRDIGAKIGIPMAVLGAIWEARDPVCGGRFQEQRSKLALDLATLACDSPWWVSFFTGPAGGYMKYVQMAADLWPVVEMILAHHVTHTVIAPGPAADPRVFGAEPDMSRYPVP